MERTPQEQLSRAIFRTATESCHFFGSAAMTLEKVLDESCGRAATDGRRLFVAPSFLASLTDAEAEFVVAHEGAHFALGHCDPIQSTIMPDKMRRNRAMDYVVNLLLVDTRGMAIPKDCLLDRRFAGMTTQQVYLKLREEDEQKKPQPKPQDDAQDEQEGQEDGEEGSKDGEGDDEQEDGAGDDPGEGDPSDQQGDGDGGAGEDKWKRFSQDVIETPADEADQARAESAAMIQRGVLAGTLPGSMAREMETILVRPRPLADHLREFLTNATTADGQYSYRRPSPMAGRGFLLPSAVGEELPPVVVLMDTSGSIDERSLAISAQELREVADDLSITELRVLYVDTEVQDRQTFRHGEDIALQPKGGGGTDFRSAFAEIEALHGDACCIVGFSDLEARFPLREPALPVLWIEVGRYGNAKAPWGKVVPGTKDRR